MPSFGLAQTVLREVAPTKSCPRIPEPDLVMDDPDKVAAFTRAGREDGIMAPVYLYHCAQILSVVRPGDRVADLGCGPATQLAMAARLQPEASFVGIDLSDEMLERARAHTSEQGLDNVDFHRGDITALTEFGDASFDAVVSTVALHQLDSVSAFRSCLSEVARLLKPGGGLYIVDFGHLKSVKSIHYFATQYEGRQPELFTIDYRNSLYAAFPRAEWRRAASDFLADHGRLYSTFAMPYMVAIKSPVRMEGAAAQRDAIARLRDAMASHQRRDLRDLALFFGLGGLTNPLLSQR